MDDFRPSTAGAVRREASSGHTLSHPTRRSEGALLYLPSPHATVRWSPPPPPIPITPAACTQARRSTTPMPGERCPWHGAWNVSGAAVWNQHPGVVVGMGWRRWRCNPGWWLVPMATLPTSPRHAPARFAPADSPLRYHIVRTSSPRFEDPAGAAVPFGVYNTDAANKQTLESVARGRQIKGGVTIKCRQA